MLDEVVINVYVRWWNKYLDHLFGLPTVLFKNGEGYKCCNTQGSFSLNHVINIGRL